MWAPASTIVFGENPSGNAYSCRPRTPERTEWSLVPRRMLRGCFSSLAVTETSAWVPRSVEENQIGIAARPPNLYVLMNSLTIREALSRLGSRSRRPLDRGAPVDRLKIFARTMPRNGHRHLHDRRRLFATQKRPRVLRPSSGGDQSASPGRSGTAARGCENRNSPGWSGRTIRRAQNFSRRIQPSALSHQRRAPHTYMLRDSKPTTGGRNTAPCFPGKPGDRAAAPARPLPGLERRNGGSAASTGSGSW